MPPSTTVSGPPESPWQESVPDANAQILVFESPLVDLLHISSDGFRILTEVYFSPHCLGCCGCWSSGLYPTVPPQPEMVAIWPE